LVASEEITAAQVLLIEYEQIKGEQRSRISFRDNLLYASLVSMAGVVAAALNVKGRADLLLLLPPVSVLLGWTYLVNDEKISAIGRYIRTDLAPRLTPASAGSGVAGGSGGAGPGTWAGVVAFGWEHAHRRDEKRRPRKLLQLAVDLTTFCVSSMSAIAIYWINGPRTAPFLSVSIAEALAIITLAVQIIRYAELHHGS
jgi:hypothetical protein